MITERIKKLFAAYIAAAARVSVGLASAVCPPKAVRKLYQTAEKRSKYEQLSLQYLRRQMHLDNHNRASYPVLLQRLLLKITKAREGCIASLLFICKK